MFTLVFAEPGWQEWYYLRKNGRLYTYLQHSFSLDLIMVLTVVLGGGGGSGGTDHRTSSPTVADNTNH